MNTNELREAYLSFFESKGCVRRPSDVLVPKDDPTVLFTPAGMNQFKNQFLGIGPIDFTRATTSQKCLRTGDIGNVGVTAYHHTFFEMLGNFSFGDYFKKEAIHWAWEFLTEKKWLGLAKDRLKVTVYLDDDEAYDIWHKEVGLSTEAIRRDDEYENFWPAGAPTDGPDGVCGPCSEIYYYPPSGGKEVEIWNLVFTQFNRVGNPPDNLRPLPKQNIDTGMGLERCAAVLQGVESNYEIDILRPLCVAAGEALDRKYEFTAPEGRALRRIADHVRACAFAIHEGVAPGSHGPEYIIRLLLRRAFLEGYLLGMREPFLHTLVPEVNALMSVPYPELSKTEKAVRETIQAEESHFLSTIDRGLGKFEKLVEKATSSGSKELPGKEVFDLHQTDGFILDLTKALAADRGLTIDLQGFKVAEDKHKATSGQGSWGVMAAGPLDAIQQSAGDTEFLAYDTTSAAAKIVGLVVAGESVESCDLADAQVDVVLDRSPFYGESGGQVGDKGAITGQALLFEVDDAQKHAGLIVHRGRLVSGTLRVGDTVQANVTSDRRAGIRRAHSATHILHHALHKVLGEHAMQRGSKVENDQLRFDFSHGAAVTPEELLEIETIINEKIAEGAPIAIDYMDLKDAKAAGAMALFGEKYPDRVRLVAMGDFSKELCGGTHLSNTGQVGLCKIEHEENVAAGVRRIVALTGKKALQRVRDTENLLRDAAIALKAPQLQEVPRKVQQLQEELQHLKKELAQYTKASVKDSVAKLLADAEAIGDAKILCVHLGNVDRDSLREYADQLRQQGGEIALLLATETEGKVALLAAVSKDLVKRGVKAGDCVREAAKIVGGGGGGRPDLAEAGGKDATKIAAALDVAREFYRGKLA
ncbi:MAG: alanine--tRNA ligase [Planctomycetaceae bacterium]|nr:alanine--tRNA ligase [Planctomycetaceae bacterium]